MTAILLIIAFATMAHIVIDTYWPGYYKTWPAYAAGLFYKPLRLNRSQRRAAKKNQVKHG